MDATTSFELQLQFLAVILITLGAIFGGYFKFKFSNNLVGKKLPPGSLGLPFIGETIGFIRAQRKDKIEEWIEKHHAKYGPVFKTSLMGSPAVVVTGQAGNKFMLSGNDAIGSNQPKTTAKILGKHSIFELHGSRHRFVRGAMMSFLRPESLQRFVGQMDAIVKQQLLLEIKCKDSIQAVMLMKKVTFNVTCSLLFGMQQSKEKDALLEDFTMAVKGSWAIPLNFPGTTFHSACQARDRIHRSLTTLVRRKKEKILEEDGVGYDDQMTESHHHEDIISVLIQLRDEDGKSFTEEEIIDNLITLIIASHDTTTIALSLLIRHLARDTLTYDLVFQEQREVLKAMEGGNGKLRWNDVQKMKYTWRVAQELMRLIAPVFGNFKRCIKDTTFGGFDIPKGWQVFCVASATHMDNKIFEEPEKFDPSRFEKLPPPYTYIPFGAGPRACPGMDFARMEILLIIHHLITNFKWTELIPDEPITREPLPYPAMGLPIKLHPRKDSESIT